MMYKDRSFKIKGLHDTRMIFTRTIDDNKEEISFVKDVVGGHLIVKRSGKVQKNISETCQNFDSVLVDKSIVHLLKEFIENKF